MGNYEQLKQAVADVIKTNGNQEITGEILQNALLSIISTIGTNATFAGIATPTTNPGTPDQNVFYIASENGTYSNFGSIILSEEVAILSNKGSSWVKSSTGIATSAKVTELEKEVIYDVTTNNDGATFASLSELLSDENLSTLIPISVRCGGMSIRFVQSSDNKYVQYKLMVDSWSIDTDDWSFCGNDVYVDNPEWIYVLLDAEKRILAGIKSDGNIYFGSGVPQQVKDYINEKIENLSLDEYEDIVTFLSGYLGSDSTLMDIIGEWNNAISGKKISILGDSISTFNQDGYKIDGYAMYYPTAASDRGADVTTVNDTWWMQVINSVAGTLEVNASSSGSTASSGNIGFSPRVPLLGNPEVIYVALGTNDSSNGVIIGEINFEAETYDLTQFAPAYIKGMQDIIAAYPKAKIVCIAFDMGTDYQNTIKTIAKHYGAEYIYVGDISVVHPNKVEMTAVANRIIQSTKYTITDAINTLSNGKVDKETQKSLIDTGYASSCSTIGNPKYLQITTDNEYKILEGITSDGYKEINIPIKTPSFDIEHKDCLGWLDVKTDNEGRILRGTKSNGVYFFGAEIESPTIDKINENLRDLDDRTDELSDTNIPFFPFVKWGRAWPQSEKKSNYEAWPFANCFYDASTGDICVAINEREKHADTNNTGCVWFRKKKENKEFGDWILISNNLDGIGKRTHATGLCGNGDYISFIIFQEVGGNGLDGTIHLFRSTDKGDSWTDEGAIQIDGVSLQSDQVSGLYLMENGRLITASHKGSNIGTSNTFVMYSDDNGLTWTKSESSASIMNANDQECSWCEIGGTLFMVTRRGYPYLYYSEDSGVTWVYSGRFNFENYHSPTSITKLPNGKYLVIGGNRAVSQNGEYPILSSVVDEAFFTKGEETPIAPITLIKFANTQGDADYSYTQAVITTNGMLYCYYYDRSKEASISPIVSYYELKGTVLGL